MAGGVAERGVACHYTVGARSAYLTEMRASVLRHPSTRTWEDVTDTLITMLALVWTGAFLLLLRPAAAVTNCHPGCHCEVENFGLFSSFSLTKVECRGLQPGPAPIPIPLDTAYLDLSSSSIQVLVDSMLSGPGYTTLVGLDLSHNFIAGISREAFARLCYLETLDLSHNALQGLADGCFAGLPLADVDLSHNRIRKLDLGVFASRGHARLMNVDISDNLLTAVIWDPRRSPLNLQNLSLAGNQLRSIPHLQGVPLRCLNLDRNPISNIKRGAFAGLTSLIHLSLSSLPDLLSIEPQSFSDLHNLQVLDLSNNTNLRSLAPEVLSGLESLQELNLSRSGVASLPRDILIHLPNIQSITLKDDVHCWRRRRQGQFHRQIGATSRRDKLTCDAAGVHKRLQCNLRKAKGATGEDTAETQLSLKRTSSVDANEIKRGSKLAALADSEELRFTPSRRYCEESKLEH
ncbi:tsukushin-like isoform X2 [Arapaima gigas]